MILGAQIGKDPRKVIPLPGDWDHVPKMLSQDESKKVLAKYGVDKILDRLVQKGNKKKR